VQHGKITKYVFLMKQLTLSPAPSDRTNLLFYNQNLARVATLKFRCSISVHLYKMRHEAELAIDLLRSWGLHKIEKFFGVLRVRGIL
jgi:hypothetical protein